MAKAFRLQVVVKESKPNKVYKAFINSETHSEFSGVKTKIDTEKMTFKSGDVSGKFLGLTANKQIVMTYKVKGWDRTIQPSVVTICFKPQEEDTLVEIFHTNVEDEFVDDIKKTWKENYIATLKKL